MLTADTAEAAALAVSQALFEQAPAVVVATPTDAEAVAAASKAATELGLPVLAATGSPSDLTDELERLGTTTVLAVDEAAQASVTAALGHSASQKAAGTSTGPQTSTPAKTNPNTTDPDDTAVETVDDPADLPELSAPSRDPARPSSRPAPPPTPSRSPPRQRPAPPWSPSRPATLAASADAIKALAAAKPSRTLALGTAFGTAQTLAPRVASAATGAQLPGGGQLVLADRRYVAMYGHPGTPVLGILGEQPLAASVARAQKLGRAYDRGLRPAGRAHLRDHHHGRERRGRARTATTPTRSTRPSSSPG